MAHLRAIRERFTSERYIPLLSLTTALFVVKESFPALNWIFYPLLLAFALLTVVLQTVKPYSTAFRFRGAFAPYALLLMVFGVFLLSIYRSGLSMASFQTELFHLGATLLLIVVHLVFINNPDLFIRYRNGFFRTLFYLVLFVSGIGLLKFWVFLRGWELPVVADAMRMSLGTSLVPDNDRFILALVAAMMGMILIKFRQKNNFLLNILYHISFLVMFYAIIWSGSKKGFLMMLFFVVALMGTRIFYLFHKSRARNYRLIRNLNILILMLGFSALAGTWVFLFVEGNQKEHWMDRLGFNSYHFKSEITLITYAHISTFNGNADLQLWYDKLWGSAKGDKKSLKDKIDFVLIEQENASVNHQDDSWVRKAFSHRKQRWDASIGLFSGYPTEKKIWGKGFAYLGHFAAPGKPPPVTEPVMWHNNYLITMLLSSGFAGLFLLLLLFGQVIICCWRNRTELIAVFSVFLITAALLLLSYNTLLTAPMLLTCIIFPLTYQSMRFRLPD